MAQADQLVNSWRRGWFATPRELKNVSADDIRAAAMTVFGPSGYNVPNPTGVAEAFVFIGKAKYAPPKDEAAEQSYLQDLATKHLNALGQVAVPLRIRSIPHGEQVVDLFNRLDDGYVSALSEATRHLEARIGVLREHQPAWFEEYPGNFFQDQNAIANSALSLTTFFAVMADRVLRDQAVVSRTRAPRNLFDPRIAISNAAMWAALSPTLTSTYPDDPYWPLLGLYAIGYWPFGKIKNGPAFFKSLKTDFVVFRLEPAESGVLNAESLVAF
ncbi:MAG: hypothetical protein U0Q11_23955 [Vicinamibacterales bacterium]